MNALLASATLLLLAGPAFAQAKVDKPAPDFAAKDVKGVERKLADFKGKLVVLEWHNKDCPYVKKHYGSYNMQTLQADYTKKGVVWLTIISSAEGKQGFVSGPEAEADMAKAEAAPTHILLDPEGTVGKRYGAKTTPHMFVINAKGKLVYNGAIDSNSSSDPAAIKDATNYVASALDALLGGKAVAKKVTRPYGCSVKYKS
ncbi:MAG: thioredoxin family protein [Elusimicrobia bacterium]|nr:thioredoxin family protein [Elusimicrobiota bacterium]